MRIRLEKIQCKLPLIEIGNLPVGGSNLTNNKADVFGSIRDLTNHNRLCYVRCLILSHLCIGKPWSITPKERRPEISSLTPLNRGGSPFLYLILGTFVKKNVTNGSDKNLKYSASRSENFVKTLMSSPQRTDLHLASPSFAVNFNNYLCKCEILGSVDSHHLSYLQQVSQNLIWLMLRVQLHQDPTKSLPINPYLGFELENLAVCLPILNGQWNKCFQQRSEFR